MCTAISYKNGGHYFGRTLDIEKSYGECVVVTPRNHVFNYRTKGAQKAGYAMIGMAVVIDDCPLYYEAANEHGVCIAGLNFPDNAHYFDPKEGKDNIVPFELIPWVLGRCQNMADVKALLANINLTNINFSENLPLSPLHWIISCGGESVVVESMSEGLKIYDDPVGVLTNNPPFDWHMANISRYLNLTAADPKNSFGAAGPVPFSKGFGAIGLPGDWSSPSRFVQAAFVNNNSVSPRDEDSNVSQFFHLLGSVEHVRGCVDLGGGEYEITAYTCCISADKGHYYYTTYQNPCVSRVDMHACDLQSDTLYCYPLNKKLHILNHN